VLEQRQVLGFGVGPVRRHDHATRPTVGTHDAQDDGLVPRIARPFEPVRAIDDKARRRMVMTARLTAKGPTVQGEVGVVALGLEQLDGVGNRFGCVHGSSLRRGGPVATRCRRQPQVCHHRDVTDQAWDNEANEVIGSDITAALAYVTPAGGAVVTAVAPCGLADRDHGTVGFTTSLGFGKKLERIVREPRIALAYHAREHGYSTSPRFVLVQGDASIDLTPSQGRLDEFAPQAERFVGAIKRGPLWDRLLREYYRERVFVDVSVTRVGDGSCDPVGAQTPPRNGTRPRVDVGRAARKLARLPHRVIAFRGADGYPVVTPIALAGHDERGIHLVDARRLLPAGGRRAGLLAHAYQPQLVGLSTRVFTGWLEVSDDGAACYAPHTDKGFSAPPRKNLLLVSNGLLAKYGLWQARRHGVAEHLRELAAVRATA
jgi:hypothetical protein